MKPGIRVALASAQPNFPIASINRSRACNRIRFLLRQDDLGVINDTVATIVDSSEMTTTTTSSMSPSTIGWRPPREWIRPAYISRDLQNTQIAIAIEVDEKSSRSSATRTFCRPSLLANRMRRKCSWFCTQMARPKRFELPRQLRNQDPQRP